MRASEASDKTLALGSGVQGPAGDDDPMREVASTRRLVAGSTWILSGNVAASLLRPGHHADAGPSTRSGRLRHLRARAERGGLYQVVASFGVGTTIVREVACNLALGRTTAFATVIATGALIVPAVGLVLTQVTNARALRW